MRQISVGVIMGILAIGLPATGTVAAKERSVQKEDKSLAVMITPTVIRDFDRPQGDVVRLYDHFQELFEGWKEVIVILAVGNADQILAYRGQGTWSDTFPWAQANSRRTDTLSLRQIKGMVDCLREQGRGRGLNITVYDMLEPGPEFCAAPWKYEHHRESFHRRKSPGNACLKVTTRLHADNVHYAAYPNGIPEGLATADFVVGQVGAYVDDLGFDGIYLGNALGTEPAWLGHEETEYRELAAVGLKFFRRLKARLGPKKVFWMDTYRTVQYEQERLFMHAQAYDAMDYIHISTWTVLVNGLTGGMPSVRANLASKLKLGRPLLFQIDTMDPWYAYDGLKHARQDVEAELALLKQHAAELAGVYVNVNDETGDLLPLVWVDRINDIFLGDDDGKRRALVAARTKRTVDKLFRTAGSDAPGELVKLMAAAKWRAYQVNVVGREEKTASFLAKLAACFNQLLELRREGKISAALQTDLAEYVGRDVLELTRFNWYDWKATGHGRSMWSSDMPPFTVMRIENRGRAPIRGVLYVRASERSALTAENSLRFGPLGFAEQASKEFEIRMTDADLAALCPANQAEAVTRLVGPGRFAYVDTDFLITFGAQYSVAVPGVRAVGTLSADLEEVLPEGAPQTFFLDAPCRVSFGPEGIEVVKQVRVNAASIKPNIIPAQTFVREWLVAGPFDCPGDQFGESAPLEKRPIDGRAAVEVRGQRRRWREYRTDEVYIDLHKLLGGKTDNQCAYAFTWVHAPRATAAILRVGIDDRMAVILNGRTVLSERSVVRHSQPGEVKREAALKAGWNALLVKVGNDSGPWGFHLQLLGKEMPLGQLVFSVSKPPPPEASGKQ